MRPWRRLGLGWILVMGAAAVWAAAPDTADTPPTPAEVPVPLLFIHHSCGGQLLAAPGETREMPGAAAGSCVLATHPNGGDLRRRLEAAGYRVHEAAYGSLVGQDTDIGDWPAKFRDHMDRILRTRQQDELLPEGETNRIVAFKSCYPNNAFVDEGDPPGDPQAPTLTVANAQAAYRALLPSFAQHPEVLFVAFTAPPLAEPQGFGYGVKKLLGRGSRQGKLARSFNTWLVDGEHGWLADYDVGNVVVFDYYAILTGDDGDWAAYATRDGRDSHPSGEGNGRAAELFVPFLQAALARQDAER